MATIKHPDTYQCDLCGTEYDDADSLTKTRIPVKWLTEQNEGRTVKPYFRVQEIDLCDSCIEKVAVIEATGCMGYNQYTLRGGR